MARDYNIVTFHRAYNYGAVLQAYALQEFLRQLGYTSGIYDYVSYGENRARGAKARILRAALRLHRRAIQKREEKYKAFVAERLSLNLENDSLAYVSGSDQVWNPNGAMEEAYFLRFAPEGAKRIAYAASMGDGTVPEERRALWESYVRDFDKISVREASLKERVEAFVDKEVVQSVDPTLLQNAEFWSGIAKPVLGIPEKYILVYLMHVPKNVNALLSWLQKETGAKIVLIESQGLSQGVFTHLIKHDIVLPSVGPDEFVFLMKNALSVVTSSFHGTAFSLIFHKEVYAVSNNPRSRVSDILGKCGLTPLREDETVFTRRTDVDFDTVSSVLAAERRASETFFEGILPERRDA